jgi:YD repeat-containing protein
LYDKDGLLTLIIRPNGAETKYEYDHAKRLSKITHPDGRVESFICPITAGIVDTQNGEGTKDKPAKLVPTDSIAGTAKKFGWTTITKYDAWGFPLHITYFSQGVTVPTVFDQLIYVRNARGQIIEEIKPTDDGQGSVVIGKTVYQYDKRGNMVKEILPLGRGVRTWEYSPTTNRSLKFVDEDGNTSIGTVNLLTGENTWQTTPAPNTPSKESDLDFTDYLQICFSPTKTSHDMIPSGLWIASIDTKGRMEGNAYNLKGKIIERFQYVKDSEVHSVNGNEKWIFSELTAGKRYEVFITWNEHFLNSPKTIFSAYQKNNDTVVFSTTLNQVKPPHRHIIGGLGQKENYQSIGRITAASNEIIITAINANPTTDNSKRKIPIGTIRLVEIKTQEGFKYNKDGQVAVKINNRNRKTEYFYDAIGREVKVIEQVRADYNKISKVYYDFAGHHAYWQDGLSDIVGRSYDVVDNEIMRFLISPKAKAIEFLPQKINAKKTQWLIDKLTSGENYEILASWKRIKNDCSNLVFTLQSGNKIEQVAIPQTASGLHPIAGNGYCSLGVFSSVDGKIKVDLNSKYDIDADKIKIVKVQPEEQRRFHKGRLVFEKSENFQKTTDYDENYNIIKEVEINKDEIEERLYEYDKDSKLIKETIKDIDGVRTFFYTPKGTIHKIIEEEREDNNSKNETKNNNTDQFQATELIRASPKFIYVKSQSEPLVVYAAAETVDATNYRTKFIEATPNMPKDGWEVHHTKQACLRARYLVERGINIDELQYLRGVPSKIHGEISGIQNQFWAEKWDLFTKSQKYKDLVKENKKITEQQLRQVMYNCTPWEEIEALEKSTDDVFKKFWIKKGAWVRSVNSVLNKVSKLPTDMHKNARRSGVWNLMKKKFGDLFLSKFPRKVGIALIGGLGMIITAKEIAVPSDTTQEKWNAFIEQFQSAIQEAENDNTLKKETAMDLTDKLVQYLQSVGAGSFFLWSVNNALYIWSTEF